MHTNTTKCMGNIEMAAGFPFAHLCALLQFYRHAGTDSNSATLFSLFEWREECGACSFFTGLAGVQMIRAGGSSIHYSIINPITAHSSTPTCFQDMNSFTSGMVKPFFVLFFVAQNLFFFFYQMEIFKLNNFRLKLLLLMTISEPDINSTRRSDCLWPSGCQNKEKTKIKCLNEAFGVTTATRTALLWLGSGCTSG